MKVLFLYVSTNMCRDGDLWFYDEGLASSAAVLRQRGHDSTLCMVHGRSDPAEILARVQAERADGDTLLVFMTSIHFSAYGHDIPDTFAKVMDLKQRTGLKTLFVGLWATLNSEALLRHPGVDMVGRGEMDLALADLCDALERGAGAEGIPNIWTADGPALQQPAMRPLVPDLDALPLPARDLLPIAAQANESDGILTVVASRGCPMSCEFCAHLVLRKAYGGVSGKSYMRHKSVDYLLREIAAARRAMPQVWGIYFHDDMFLLDPEWSAEFMARYPGAVDLPFGCNLVIGQVKPQFIAALAAAGCRQVLIGIESGSERIRTEVFNKPLRDEQIMAALELCRSHGILVKFYALVGAAGETRRDLCESYKGFARYLADMVQVQVCMPHETSDLLAADPRAGDLARQQYEPGRDGAAWRLKFDFHYFHRYVALYHLLGRERSAPIRARLLRALVTLSVLCPWTPHLLMTRDWDGRRRWPHRLRGLGRLGSWFLGGFGRRLKAAVLELEQSLAADYIRPPGTGAPELSGPARGRSDQRRRQARDLVSS